MRIIQAKALATYNQSMNEQLYAVCAKLSEAERRKDCKVFFKSVHGTLNHLLLVDRLWIGGFTNNPFSITGLDQELYADFDELGLERKKTDEFICGWAGGLKESDLDELFKGIGLPLWTLVTHFFNHQTHHRGQLSAILSQCGHDYGVTDLPWVPGVRETVLGAQ